jgi:hypothetical protein
VNRESSIKEYSRLTIDDSRLVCKLYALHQLDREEPRIDHSPGKETMIRKGLLLITALYALSHGNAQESTGPHFRMPATDSATAPTSLKYPKGSIFKRFLMGVNYREVWSTPVKAPVFRLSQTDFKIEELGGGQQTKSLQMKDSKGKKWVLRTIDKEVSGALPPALRGTIAQKVTQDMVSGAHPHAPLVVAQLAKDLGISAPDPILYYVVSDPAMGKFDSLFANTFCFLEQREPTPDNSKTDDTEEAVEELAEKNNRVVLQRQVLKARLLDMLIADWDRHYDQWRWGKKDSAGLKYYYAIPRDRDQAFFNSRGALVPVARLLALKHLVGFRFSTKKVRKLNFKSWSFDKYFINELDRGEWQAVITEFQQALTNEKLAAAAKKLPPETYRINGPEIEAKLASRRDGLGEDALRYYKFISRQVTVNGTSEKETFHLSPRNDGVVLKVINDEGKQVYERTIISDETGRIILNGFGGADEFRIDAGVPRGIRLTINGGEGSDLYDLQGNISTRVYELENEKNEFRNKANTRVRFVK